MDTMKPVKAEPLDDDAMVAWFEGRRPRRLLAIPFGGHKSSPWYAKGMDEDNEAFTERTDIKPGWLEYRKVDFHHSWDDLIGPTVIGKADRLGSFDGQDDPDEDGWWVDLWFERGQKYVQSIRRLLERGTELYGSSQSVAGMVKKAATGEILRWPYWRQTLSPTPRNLKSVLTPLKATSDFSAADWAAISDELRALGSELRPNSTLGSSGGAAKTGRVLSGINEHDIDEAVQALLGSADKLRAVLARHRKEPTQ